jgi:hypothetical protein
MADNAENGSPQQAEAPDADTPQSLNIKVTDNNNEVFFKIKRTTKLEKLMNAFCERQGKNPATVRFHFEGQRVQITDTPDTVCTLFPFPFLVCPLVIASSALQTNAHRPLVCLMMLVLMHGLLWQLEMADGDVLEVHQEQVGGGSQ